VTRLRQRMLDELQRRNYSPHTVRCYLHAVEAFALYFHRSPEQLGPDHTREYQVHLFRDCKLSPRTIEGQTAALRFLFVKTLRRPYMPDQIPFPKCHKRLPTVLSQEEVARLIECSGSLMQRAMIMTLYATGLRRAELCRLKVSDIDSERMVLHVQQGKGGRDRDLPLSPKLLDILRSSGSSFCERHGPHLALQHRKVMDAIVRCRSAVIVISASAAGIRPSVINREGGGPNTRRRPRFTE
jgi:integrase/recombinase XerD